MSYGKAETLAAGSRLGAQLEIRQVIGKRDFHERFSVRTDCDERIVVRHGLEILSNRNFIEQRFLPALVAAGIFRKGQTAEGQVARIMDLDKGMDLPDKIRYWIKTLLLAQGQHCLVNKPESDLPGQRFA